MIKATKKEMCIIDTQGGVYSYLNSDYAKRGNVIYKINATDNPLECELENNLADKLLKAQEDAAKLGCFLTPHNIESENHLESIFSCDYNTPKTYKGCIEYDGYTGYVQATGEINLTVFDEDGNEYATFSTRRGDRPEELYKIIKDDKHYKEILSQGRINIENNNWWYLEVDAPSGRVYHYDDVLKDNLLENFENVQWFIDFVENLKKEGKK